MYQKEGGWQHNVKDDHRGKSWEWHSPCTMEEPRSSGMLAPSAGLSLYKALSTCCHYIHFLWFCVTEQLSAGQFGHDCLYRGKWKQERHEVSGLLNDTYFAHISVSSSLVQPWVMCSQEVHWIWNCVHKGKLTNLTHWLPNWLMTVLQGSLGDRQPVSLVITCTPFCIYLCAELFYWSKVGKLFL